MTSVFLSLHFIFIDVVSNGLEFILILKIVIAMVITILKIGLITA